VQTRIYATLGDTAGSAVGARDFSSAGGAPLPARFSSATRASARTLGSLSLSSSRSSGTTDSIPGCPGPRRPRCHAARLRTKEIPSRVSATKAGRGGAPAMTAVGDQIDRLGLGGGASQQRVELGQLLLSSRRKPAACSSWLITGKSALFR
jgi:hypothetical protein